MKKIFVSLMMVAGMAAAVSCACSSNSDKADGKCTTEQCAGCDKADSCTETAGCQSEAEEKCPGCDSTAVKDSCCNRN